MSSVDKEEDNMAGDNKKMMLSIHMDSTGRVVSSSPRMPAGGRSQSIGCFNPGGGGVERGAQVREALQEQKEAVKEW